MAQEQVSVIASDQSQVDERLETLLQRLGAIGGQEAVANLRQAVLRDVEVRVSEKSEDLWRKGRAMLDKLETKHCEETGRFASQVVEYNARADSLETENAKLRRQVEELSARLSSVSVFFGSGAAPATTAATELDASAGTTSKGLVAQPPGLERPMPYVPPFPDPEGKSAKAPLSLAESLASPRPAAATHAARPKMPLTLSDTITPPATPGADPNRERSVFSFTLRKADGLGLGLNISHAEADESLLVEGVRPDGAVGAWNRLCAGGPTAEKAVRAGDRITSVNGISQDPQRMLDECRDRTTVKLTVMRSDTPPVINTLRAEAAAFVPGALGVEAKPTSLAAASPEPEATPEAEEVQ